MSTRTVKAAVLAAALTATTLIGPATIAPPAQAWSLGKLVNHMDPDHGNHRRIPIRCQWGKDKHYLYLGDNSWDADKCGASRPKEVYIYSGVEVWCEAGGSWHKRGDATGWMDVGWGARWDDCTTRSDS